MKVQTTAFKRCACGAEVALLPAKAGGWYSVEVEHIDTSGPMRRAIVDNTDFHHCAEYHGLAEFVRRAMERGARRLRMRLLTGDDEPVLLSWTSGGRNWVYVSDGGDGDDRQYYGKVDLNAGGFVSSDDGAPEDVLDLLQAVSDHPLEAVKAYGRATGACCFCDRDLDVERSVEAGYGPNCAKRFQLPWGDEGETTKGRAKRTRKAVKIEQ